MASLVKSTLRKPGEYSVARVEITLDAKVSSGLASAAEKRVCWEEGSADLPEICDDCWFDVRELRKLWKYDLEVD